MREPTCTNPPPPPPPPPLPPCHHVQIVVQYISFANDWTVSAQQRARLVNVIATVLQMSAAQRAKVGAAPAPASGGGRAQQPQPQPQPQRYQSPVALAAPPSEYSAAASRLLSPSGAQPSVHQPTQAAEAASSPAAAAAAGVAAAFAATTRSDSSSGLLRDVDLTSPLRGGGAGGGGGLDDAYRFLAALPAASAAGTALQFDTGPRDRDAVGDPGARGTAAAHSGQGPPPGRPLRLTNVDGLERAASYM